MPAFPSISTNPSVDGYGERPVSVEPLNYPEEKRGAMVARNRVINNKKGWSVSYRTVTSADKETLSAWYSGTIAWGAVSFTWTEPGTGTGYTVIFANTPKYKRTRSNVGHWDISFQLEEV